MGCAKGIMPLSQGVTGAQGGRPTKGVPKRPREAIAHRPAEALGQRQMQPIRTPSTSEQPPPSRGLAVDRVLGCAPWNRCSGEARGAGAQTDMVRIRRCPHKSPRALRRESSWKLTVVGAAVRGAGLGARALPSEGA